MEFDESKVYTALNADKLKIGSKVIVADSLKRLKSFVDGDCEAKELVDIRGDSTLYRFNVMENDYECVYALAYLVSEPEENKLTWTDLKVGDVITNGKTTAMVIVSDSNSYPHIFVGYRWLSDVELKNWEKVEHEEVIK